VHLNADSDSALYAVTQLSFEKTPPSCLFSVKMHQMKFDRLKRSQPTRIVDNVAPRRARSFVEIAYSSLEPVVKVLLVFRVRPNHLSWSSVFFGVGAGLCVADGRFGFAGLLYAFAGFLDMLDGALARGSNQASEAGHVLDTVLDRYVEFLFFFGIIFYYRAHLLPFCIAMLALIGSYMVSYLTLLAREKRVAHVKIRIFMRRPERMCILIAGALLSSVLMQKLEPIEQNQIPMGYPLIIALSIVALFANFFAIRHLFWLKSIVSLGATSEPTDKK